MKLSDEMFDSVCDRVDEVSKLIEGIGKQHGLGPRQMALVTTLTLVIMLDTYDIPREKVIELVKDLTSYKVPPTKDAD